MFIDRVTVQFSAGKGGNGVVAWRREKFIPKGGPVGGNGGKGGSIILKADEQTFSLDWFRHRRLIKAENGRDGGTNSRQGRRGVDLVLTVPCGTLVKEASTGRILHDFVQPGDEWLLCSGGRGGRGNESFKTPTNRAPNQCTAGMTGEAKQIELELKLIADVGLIGFPNAGKSTLISSLAGIKAKVAAYPFTTLQPNLGFIEYSDYTRIYLADIPGIIEGASRNRGLGLEFLRHVERTRLLIYILDASGIEGRTPISDFLILREELRAYRPDLVERPHLVVLNKVDIPESQALIELFKQDFPELRDSLYEISAAYGQGLEALLHGISIHFQEAIDGQKSADHVP